MTPYKSETSNNHNYCLSHIPEFQYNGIELSSVFTSNSSQTILTTINDKQVHSFIDSGAGKSLIRYDTLATLTKDNPIHIKKPFVKLVTVTGDPVELVGSVTLNLFLGNSEIIHNFHVAKTTEKNETVAFRS